MNRSFSPTVTGVILAGGQARRMAGKDKGLLLYKQKVLISYVIAAIESQVDILIINANRNIDQYKSFGYQVITDILGDFSGPLAGMLSAMTAVNTDYILTAPCDSPNISPKLRQRMMEALLFQQADIAVAHDGEHLQPVFCLLPCRLHAELAAYLMQGGRKINLWLEQYKLAVVDFSDQAETFLNFNLPDELSDDQANLASPVPLLGFAAFSGTGKTTLLRQLIPALNRQGLRVAVIKHAHHDFDIDIPGKDSYEMREAGAEQVLVASSRLMALMEVQPPNMIDASLEKLIPRLDSTKLDLILVEGFKHEMIPKIELYRPILAKPLLYPDDKNIMAIATDSPLSEKTTIDQLDLNNIDEMVHYIQLFIAKVNHG